MFQYITNLVPPEASAAMVWLLAGGALIGAALWLFGSRFGRSLLALVMVGLGAIIGLHLPQLLDLPIGGWTAAIGMALIFGVAGFAMQRTWTAIGLGLLLASWVAAAVSKIYLADSLTAIKLSPANGLLTMATQAWDALPADLRRIGPFACGIAMVSGVSLGVMWLRLASYLFWSALGVSMMLTMGLPALTIAQPQLVDNLPQDGTRQLLAVIGLVLFGMLVQWRMAPRRLPAAIAVEPQKPQ